MRVSFERNFVRKPRWGVVYGGLALAGLAASRLLVPLLRLAPPCAFHALTGLPCPSCGATRSAVFLAQGQLVRSFLINPLFFFLYVGLLLWGALDLYLTVRKEKLVLKLTSTEKWLLRLGVLMAVAANWLYLIASGVVDHCQL